MLHFLWCCLRPLAAIQWFDTPIFCKRIEMSFERGGRERAFISSQNQTTHNAVTVMAEQVLWQDDRKGVCLFCRPVKLPINVWLSDSYALLLLFRFTVLQRQSDEYSLSLPHNACCTHDSFSSITRVYLIPSASSVVSTGGRYMFQWQG